MSYTPTVWKTGDIVSSQRLNKLEEGVEGAYEVMVINTVTEDPAQSAKNLLRASGRGDLFLDKTWQQIFDAMNAGRLCVIKDGNETVVVLNLVTSAGVSDEGYKIFAIGNVAYAASSADGYPHK